MQMILVSHVRTVLKVKNSSHFWCATSAPAATRLASPCTPRVRAGNESSRSLKFYNPYLGFLHVESDTIWCLLTTYHDFKLCEGSFPALLRVLPAARVPRRPRTATMVCARPARRRAGTASMRRRSTRQR